jgi:CRISPR/Cas system-associated endonuclease Cas3-HD
MEKKLKGSDIDLICRNNLEYMFMASLISSDNIRTIADAEKSLEFIDDVEKAVKEAPISNEKKAEFEKYIVKGRSILNGDIERFKEN